MAFHLRDEQDDVMGDINVTPLVDVMLVLLVIFMVTAPMIQQGVEVSVPRVKASKLWRSDRHYPHTARLSGAQRAFEGTS